jgi:hypothetical protein
MPRQSRETLFSTSFRASLGRAKSVFQVGMIIRFTSRNPTQLPIFSIVAMGSIHSKKTRPRSPLCKSGGFDQKHHVAIFADIILFVVGFAAQMSQRIFLESFF